LAVAVILAVAVPASAIPLSNFAGGPIQIKFTNLDTGTLYNVGAGNQGPFVGEATLDGLAQTPPPNRFGIEDSWGIARVSEIDDSLGNVLWSRVSNNEELVGIFWGERDTYFNQTLINGQTSQEIHGVGQKIAFFSVPGNQVINLPGTFTTANRTAEDVVTGLNTLPGTSLLWTLNTVPGFNDAFPTDEFFTTFFPPGNSFGGLNAFGGMYAQVGTVNLFGGGSILGPDNSRFIGTPSWRITFTGQLPDPTNTGFLVKSNDPINAQVVPEPMTMAGLLLGLGTLVGYARKRNGK
jgi:hypothetical protein